MTNAIVVLVLVIVIITATKGAAKHLMGPMAMAELPQPDCFAQPFWFGVPYSKTLIPRMSVFTLAISCLTTSNLP